MDTNELKLNEPTSTAQQDAPDVESLSQIFDDAFALFNDINKTQEATNSVKVQSDIKRAMSLLEDSTRLVSFANIFSSNESIEEVATGNIKYFLLPALLGTLTMKICGSSDRSHLIDVAEIYFVDFLKRVKSYGLTDIEIPEKQTNDESSAVQRPMSKTELITYLVSTRHAKLERYKVQKDLETRLQTMGENMKNLHIDEDIRREYYMTLIKSYVNQVLDDLGSIAAERPILEHMMKVGRQQTTSSQKPKPPATKLQPIIITRNQLQKQVYGAGYPSLPVMTVDEFYEKRIKDGDWPDPSKRNQSGGKSLQELAMSNDVTDDKISEEDLEAQQKEEQTEKDDPELLAQARAMDDYKDTHRQGWGNRANRS